MSQGTTLHPGTIIITGTPSGIGNGRVPRIWLKDGDRVSCSISHGIGTLSSDIVYQDAGQKSHDF
jgi:2-keto-4-pentenoate hydratase/2-oxohepta-3-ene-1,7-dioic acid hydratase in catechol pathway